MNVEKRQRIERRIAREAIKGLLAEGYKISVFDGEETVLTKSVDPAAIEKAMFSTDEDQFHVERDGGEKPETGWVLFVYGNDGWDVIADNTVNLVRFRIELRAIHVSRSTSGDRQPRPRSGRS